MKRIIAIILSLWASAALIGAAAGCLPPEDKATQSDTPRHIKEVTPQLPNEAQEELAAIQEQLAEVESLTAEQFAEKYAVPFSPGPSYDATQATGMSIIQGSTLALDSAELAGLQQNGFVIAERQRFPTFIHGYTAIYGEDLPIYVSADSIMHAVHQSYDEILLFIEKRTLIPALGGMLDSMRGQLGAGAGGELGPQARMDADLYLTVAASLLQDELLAPAAGADSAAIGQLFSFAQAASDAPTIELFGVKRFIDFSQFKPRGHYAGDPALEGYFRAMMWLGRIDLRIIETQPDHSQVFHRRQLEAAFVLRSLMDAAAQEDWQRIDRIVTAFVGEHDYMILPELAALLADLGLSSPADLANVSDGELAQAVLDGGYGTQRISSHIMINGLGQGTMPLSSSFALFGQRYVVDSHVFANVVFDRVQNGTVDRMMPNPLDVAFAALDNNQAGLLLGPELAEYPYAPDLASMRILVDAHPADYWEANLYSLWLGALRSLAPNSDEVQDPLAAGLPELAGTEPWGRRLLNTQLASWAELRHDTLLYAKQSYTGGETCEFPDAYVEPSPEFFARVVAFASHGKTLLASLDLDDWTIGVAGAYFTRLQEIAGILGEMAEHQRSGAPHTQAHMAFINQAVTLEAMCGNFVPNGWYADLFFNAEDALEYDPTIADVHTQPTDENGMVVGKVLHVATGMPRLMVVTADTCSGPRAYAGLASSYFEHITTDFERLDDEQWAASTQSATPADVGWMLDLVVR